VAHENLGSAVAIRQLHMLSYIETNTVTAVISFWNCEDWRARTHHQCTHAYTSYVQQQPQNPQVSTQGTLYDQAVGQDNYGGDGGRG
jgi:hypothetical protein